MNENQAPAEIAATSGCGHDKAHAVLFVAAAVISFFWFMWLSAAVHIEAGSPLLDNVDYLFSADIPPRVSRLSDPDQSSAGSSLSHPLLYPVWGQAGQALHAAFGNFLSDPEARIVAIRDSL